MGLADVSKTGPIQGVRRIWAGGNLIYDAGGDDLETIIASNQAAQGFRIYFGGEDQQPDPRMQADLGVGNCPAYRGLAYIVFYDFALKDYGNSLMAAQVKVELLSDANEQVIGETSRITANNPHATNGVYAAAFHYSEPFVYYALPDNDTRLSETPSVSIYAYNVIDSTSRIYRKNQRVDGVIGINRNTRRFA